jgi:hypothetical protein
MKKKNRNIVPGLIIGLLFGFLVPALRAQSSLTMEIDEKNIGSDIIKSYVAFNIGADCWRIQECFVQAMGGGNFRDTENTGISGPAVSIIKLKIKTLDGKSYSSDYTPEVILSSRNEQPLAVRRILFPAGAGEIQARIPAAELSGYRWEAGNYETDLSYRANAMNSRNCFFNQSAISKLRLIVRPYLSIDPVSNVIIRLDRLDDFRSDASAIQVFNCRHSVPVNIQAKAAQSPFIYAHVPANILLSPRVESEVIQIQGEDGGKVTDLSFSTKQDIFSKGIPVGPGNKTTKNIRFFIKSEVIRRKFAAAGNYRLRVLYDTYDARGSGVRKVPGTTSSFNLEVAVADLGELKINDATVNLQLNSAADYRNGTAIDLPNHLRLSKTTPYDVYVRSVTSSLSNGDQQIPVSAIQIGPSAGESGVSMVTLSASPQKIISGNVPVIDRNIGIQYSISPASAQQLSGKQRGSYTTTIIYNFTAL